VDKKGKKNPLVGKKNTKTTVSHAVNYTLGIHASGWMGTLNFGSKGVFASTPQILLFLTLVIPKFISTFHIKGIYNR
jgi:hypothetical protein